MGEPTGGARRLGGLWWYMLLAVVALPALPACGDGASPEPGWAGAVDTLPGGTVRVSNPEQGLWGPGDGWELVEELRLGTVDGDGPELFGRITHVQVDSAGRIYVLDAQASEVRIFSAGGDHVGTFGGPGEGPGELKQPQGLDLGSDGRVRVVDLGNQRYVTIDSTGSLVKETRRFTGGNVSPWPGAFLADGRVIDVDFASVDGEPTRTYLLHSSDGEILDTVPMPSYDGPRFELTTESSRVAAGVPFAPGIERAWDPSGGLWVGVPATYRVVRTDLDGDTTRIVLRDHTPVPVSPGQKDAAMESLEWFVRQGGEIDRARIPDEHPAYQSLHLDRAGHLWVRPSVRREIEGTVTPEDLYGPRPAVFDVFDPRGRYLGRVESSIPLLRPVIGGSTLHALTVGELGVPQVVRMAIRGR